MAHNYQNSVGDFIYDLFGSVSINLWFDSAN